MHKINPPEAIFKKLNLNNKHDIRIINFSKTNYLEFLVFTNKLYFESVI